jgi:Transposase DDE domain
MAVADRHGLPVAVCTESATPHEVKRVMQTLAEIFVEEPIQRLIGDNAYDSDQLDRELAETGVEMIAPHRCNRTNLTQDGRPLRRYRHRWKIERLIVFGSRCLTVSFISLTFEPPTDGHLFQVSAQAAVSSLYGFDFQIHAGLDIH